MDEFGLDGGHFVHEGRKPYGDSSEGSYRKLRVWQEGVALALAIYKITSKFPSEEIYGLMSQMRRAAVSIPSNVAEGSGRRSSSDFARFITVSIGSLRELETQLTIAYELGYVTHPDDLFLHCDRLARMLNRLHISLSSPPKTQDP